jgi:hypothetical protein
MITKKVLVTSLVLVAVIAACVGYVSASKAMCYNSGAACVEMLEPGTVLFTVLSPGDHISYHVTYLGSGGSISEFEDMFKENVNLLIELTEIEEVIDSVDGVACLGDMPCTTYLGAWTKEDGFSFQYAWGSTPVRAKTPTLSPTKSPIPTKTKKLVENPPEMDVKYNPPSPFGIQDSSQQNAFNVFS